MVTNKCLKILSRGGIIIYPTDTVYGIGCDATNINSILKINKIKKREPNTPLICLMDGLEMVKKYVSNVPDISLDYLLNSDDPTTVIFSKSKNLESYPESIAVRIPKNKICLMHCVLNYPTEDKFANLKFIQTLKKLFHREFCTLQ